MKGSGPRLIVARLMGAEEEKCAERADRSRESFNPLVNEAEECGRGGESISRQGRPSEVAVHKYPHQRNGGFMANLRPGLWLTR